MTATTDEARFLALAAIVHGGDSLPATAMDELLELIIAGCGSDDQIGTLLLALRSRGETAEEIAGAATTLRRHLIRIPSHHPQLIDTCGTGGDHSGTFNISTAAAVVVAACGLPVAKHGNRAISSRSGSADVLVELGVDVTADPATVGRCLDRLGIGFCFAPLLHPAMRRVAALRRALGVPTIFNLLGPLTNPAGAPFQLLGVGRPEMRARMAAALARLGTQRAAVVCGRDGLDEVTLGDLTEVAVVDGGTISEQLWSPADFGLPRCGIDRLQAESPVTSAALIRHLLDGQPGPARDIVLANAAAALWVAGKTPTLALGVSLAASAIDSGRARTLLNELAKLSHIGRTPDAPPPENSTPETPDPIS